MCISVSFLFGLLIKEPYKPDNIINNYNIINNLKQGQLNTALMAFISFY